MGELAYGIIPGYQCKGLMKEALLRVLEYAFCVMKLRTLEAYTEENNVKSINLLEGIKFIEVNRVKEEGYHNNRNYQMIVYRLENNTQ